MFNFFKKSNTEEKYTIALNKIDQVTNCFYESDIFVSYLQDQSNNPDGDGNINTEMGYCNITNNKTSWLNWFDMLNIKYSKYKNNLIPLFRTGINDDLICYFEGKYVIIHYGAGPKEVERCYEPGEVNLLCKEFIIRMGF